MWNVEREKKIMVKLKMVKFSELEIEWETEKGNRSGVRNERENEKNNNVKWNKNEKKGEE